MFKEQSTDTDMVPAAINIPWYFLKPGGIKLKKEDNPFRGSSSFYEKFFYLFTQSSV